jgi:hypothetical protein
VPLGSCASTELDAVRILAAMSSAHPRRLSSEMENYWPLPATYSDEFISYMDFFALCSSILADFYMNFKNDKCF